jgi:hypothetical protein
VCAQLAGQETSNLAPVPLSPCPPVPLPRSPLDPHALDALLARDPPAAALALAALAEGQRHAQARAQALLPTRHGTAVCAAALLAEWAWLLRAAGELGG